MLDNSDINKLRIEFYKKYGPCRIVRLRTIDNQLRYYLCQFKHDRILSVLAGGTSYQEILNQL